VPLEEDAGSLGVTPDAAEWMIDTDSPGVSVCIFCVLRALDF